MACLSNTSYTQTSKPMQCKFQHTFLHRKHCIQLPIIYVCSCTRVYASTCGNTSILFARMQKNRKCNALHMFTQAPPYTQVQPSRVINVSDRLNVAPGLPGWWKYAILRCTCSCACVQEV